MNKLSVINKKKKEAKKKNLHHQQKQLNFGVAGLKKRGNYMAHQISVFCEKSLQVCNFNTLDVYYEQHRLNESLLKLQ